MFRIDFVEYTSNCKLKCKMYEIKLLVFSNVLHYVCMNIRIFKRLISVSKIFYKQSDKQFKEGKTDVHIIITIDILKQLQKLHIISINEFI